ncbi:FMN-binding protein [Parapedobacter indicus]|uniref:Uncharacterized protein n=1 Tax=Parapedobacter indicus TaxID=1477437 RepID=A0A1I3H3F3_9SPHI|nr:FMN-binding protein [Parapedobacter indicus]PPL02882.1 hypothetical protein CLV26_103208 [Parapedobacter indicus]SFI30153.1 hypothetical protein SAMN05444682_103207 [Parapedobacter indicus]
MRRHGLWILSAFFLSAFVQPPTTYYSSRALRNQALNPATGGKEYTIRDDHGQPMSVASRMGTDGLPYWYYRIFTPVCLTGECRPIDIGIYWHFSGRYLGIEIYREPLTKTDHSEFSPLDYDRLESILQNEWSDLREYTAEELVEPTDKANDQPQVDGVTGATRKAISEAAVKDAVYTTHTIWHLIHVGEPEQLALLALSKMANEPTLAHRLLATEDMENRNFVLRGVIDGHLDVDSVIEKSILQGLSAEDNTYRDLAFKALSRLNLSTLSLQKALSTAYPQLEAGEKVRLLTALEQTDALHPALQTVLSAEFTSDTQPWVLIKILSLFRQTGALLTDEEQSTIRGVETSHTALQKALKDFFE